MARVIKPSSVFNTAYEPLDTGSWKTRVLDADRALSRQWTKPEVVMKAGDAIGGLIANQYLKSSDRSAAARRVREGKEAQGLLKPTSPHEQRLTDRDKINREALFAARETMRRQKLEEPEKVKRAAALIARAKAQDWEGKAARTRGIGEGRVDAHVAARMRGGHFPGSDPKKPDETVYRPAYGSLAEARSLAAGASHPDDPEQALALRNAAALARSRAYDRSRGHTLSDIIAGKVEGEETRRDLKELFPPIMRKPEVKKSRPRGRGPTGAYSQDPAKVLRKRFKESPKVKASRLAVDIRNAGFTDPNKQFIGTPAGMSQVPVGAGNLGTQLESMFVEVPAMRVGGTGAGTGMAWIRSPTQYELGLIDKPGGYTREQLYSVLAREARAAFLAAADLNQLKINIGEITQLDAAIEAFALRSAGAHRGVPLSTDIDKQQQQKWLGTGAIMPSVAPPSEPGDDPGGAGTGGGADGDVGAGQQSQENILKSMRMKMRQVRSAYRGDTDDGISPERLQRAKDILGAKGNEDIEAITVIAMIK